MTDILERLSQGEISYHLPSGNVYEGPTPLHTEAYREIADLRKRNQALEAALTPDVNTKAHYIGEFYIEVEDFNPEYDEYFDVNSLTLSDYSDQELGHFVRLHASPTLKTKHPVDWTTIKDIMKAIKEYADGISSSSKT